MKTMLLTSAGMDVKDEILKILPKPANQMRVAHIITASKVEPDAAYYVAKDREAMKEMGFKVQDIDIETKNAKQLKNILSKFDIIYIQGGNTFYLLKAARESGFDQIIDDLINQGIIYIGVSAGSVLAGSTIETAGWKNADPNDVDLKDLTGLKLVPFNIFVHYESSWDNTIKSETRKSKYPLRILTNDQALLVKDNEIKLVGKGNEIKL